MTLPAPPPYAGRSLAALLPAVLSALGEPAQGSSTQGSPTPGPLSSGALQAGVRRACVLLVDGLGWQLLRRHPEAAPFLTSCLAGAAPLTVGFPATTATSMGSLGTGLPPGSHGIVGYDVAVPGTGTVMNSLTWRDGPEPTAWQPHPTVFERAAAAGIEVTRIGPRFFDGSGLTEAALRGGAFVGAEAVGERAAAAAAALRRGSRSLVYVYYGDLDATGHRSGCESPAWELQLAHVDLLVEQLAASLPSDAALWVTADHGMVDVSPDRHIDLAREPELRAGVELLAGEPRARFVHVRPGARDDVLAAWRARLGESMWVLSRDEAVAAGWFGAVDPSVLPRIGDVVAAASADVAVVDSERESPAVLALVGLHGSLTDAERLVPLVEVAPAA